MYQTRTRDPILGRASGVAGVSRRGACRLAEQSARRGVAVPRSGGREGGRGRGRLIGYQLGSHTHSRLSFACSIGHFRPAPAVTSRACAVLEEKRASRATRTRPVHLTLYATNLFLYNGPWIVMFCFREGSTGVCSRVPYDRATSNVIVAALDPILQATRPSFLTTLSFERFSFGEIPARIEGVKAGGGDIYTASTIF